MEISAPLPFHDEGTIVQRIPIPVRVQSDPTNHTFQTSLSDMGTLADQSYSILPDRFGEPVTSEQFYPPLGSVVTEILGHSPIQEWQSVSDFGGDFSRISSLLEMEVTGTAAPLPPELTLPGCSDLGLREDWQ